MSPRMGMIVYAHTQEVRSGGFVYEGLDKN